VQPSRRAAPIPAWTLRGRRLEWGERAYVMGIINATPDSFSGDGLVDVSAAVARAMDFVAAGADFIDIGGESTRPGHRPVPEEEEARRVLPVVKAVRAAVGVPISIDTFKPSVALAALDAGADAINCVWGAVPGIVGVAARSNAPLVIMHNRTAADYSGDVVREVIDSLERSIRDAMDGGVAADRIIVDPGIGFGKTPAQNIAILNRLAEFAERLPHPLLVGTSRKSFLGFITGLPVTDRLCPTAATVALAVASGADIVRVHDVREMVPVVRVAEAISGRSSKLDDLSTKVDLYKRPS